MLSPQVWRRWHRWIGAPAAVFLVFVSITGFLVAGTEFFGAEEALREANRDLISPIHTDTPLAAWSGSLEAAMRVAAEKFPGAPVDKITVALKGEAPTLSVYLGKPTGGEDTQLVFDARSGAFLRTDTYVDKPLLHRIHSGEVFGDGGLVASMFWALALLALTISGFLLYWRLFTAQRANRTGLKRFFF
jgi:uncharacterized iron-regulated membrane protein